MHSECLDGPEDQEDHEDPDLSERATYSTHTIWASGADRIRSVQAQRTTNPSASILSQKRSHFLRRVQHRLPKVLDLFCRHRQVETDQSPLGDPPAFLEQAEEDVLEPRECGWGG